MPDPYIPAIPSTISYEKLEYLTAGSTSFVYAIDEKRVLKRYIESETAPTELEVYKRLAPHPSIVKFFGTTDNGDIIIERGQQVHTVCEKADKVSLREKLRWLKQAAEGIQHLHNNSIVWADVSCYNMVVTTKRRWKLSRRTYLKLFDFEGSSLDGSEACSNYQWFNYKRSEPAISIQTDIFAYGCFAYEMLTGKHPHHEYEKSNNRKDEVRNLYDLGKFPDLTGVPLPWSELIQGCWQGRFSSMAEIIRQF